MAATLTGDKKLDRKLKELADKSARKVAAQGIRAGMRVIAKGIKAEIPPHMKSARKAVSSRFAKAKGGPNKGIIQAKAGNVGPQLKRGKGKGKRFIGARAEGAKKRPGVGIGRRNLHWILLGTAERFKEPKITAERKLAPASTGIMPAIGFAVLMKIMMKNAYIPYFILGFVAAAWIELPILAIAAAATAMAIIDFMRKTEPTPVTAPAEDFEDGI